MTQPVDIAAGHAAVLARIELGRPPDRSELRELVALAERTGHPELVGPLRLTWAWIELDRGRPAACLRQLDLATNGPAELTGVDAARARCLRGLHSCATGRHAESLAELNAAIREIRRHDDPHWLGNALVGRGTTLAYLLRTREADADYAEAAALFADVALHPAFSQQELDSLRPQLLAAIEQSTEDWFSEGYKAVRGAYFAQSPYKRLAVGNADVVAKLTPAALRAHWIARW